MLDGSGLKRGVCSRDEGHKNRATIPIYRIISRGRSSSIWKINIKIYFGKRFVRCELRSIDIELSDYSNEASVIIKVFSS